MTWIIRVGATGFEPATCAPKTPHRSSTALGFQAISYFLLGSAKFVMTNKAIFVRNLSAKY